MAKKHKMGKKEWMFWIILGLVLLIIGFIVGMYSTKQRYDNLIGEVIKVYSAEKDEPIGDIGIDNKESKVTECMERTGQSREDCELWVGIAYY